MLLSDKYKLIVEIGSGSFGKVYVGQNIKNGESYAIKIEQKGTRSRLSEEKKIYKKLIKNGITSGIPKFVEFFKTSKENILIMQLLGKDLDELLKLNGGIFDIQCVLYLGITIVTLLKNIHNAGFIHRDIKPNNFIIGYDNPDELYIMDFGLSKQYINGNSHIDMKIEKSPIGTARYNSINVHMGFEPSRRDDLEAVGYMLIYFLKGKLPWQGLKEKKGEDKIKLIGNVKMYTSLEKLCNKLPQCFIEYIKYCKKLKFEDIPDYEYLISLFETEIRNNNYDLKYCWCK